MDNRTKKLNKIKIKSTTELILPKVESAPVTRVIRRLNSFIDNSDWIYDAINLFDKFISGNININHFDDWVLNRLDLKIKIFDKETCLLDRYDEILTIDLLITIRNRIKVIASEYAEKLIKETDLHPVESVFRKALKKRNKQKLSPEEENSLRDAYIKVNKNNNLLNLKNEIIKLPRLKFLFF